MDKATFITTLRADRALWDDLLAELLPLGEAALIAPGAAGAWSVKDVLSHVAWFEREMVGVVRTRALVGSDLWNLAQDQRNAAIFAQNRDRSLPDVLAEATRTYAEMLAAVETLTDADLADPAHFAEMPADWRPWEVIASNSFEHYRDHALALRAWLAAQR
ncbi:MAG: ClbS/DfsB family four-helix bundle protein [Chloroflexi bacterium]|nr:ClbS/DfsB family four-helix bundle protein [Chloroflexota bacterium]